MFLKSSRHVKKSEDVYEFELSFFKDFILLCSVKIMFCKAFTAEKKQQLATPSYRVQREKEQSKKISTASLSTDTLTLVDPADCKLLEKTPADKKKFLQIHLKPAS